MGLGEGGQLAGERVAGGGESDDMEVGVVAAL